MKHEVTNMLTKKALAHSFIACLEQKPLSKITVSEIVNHCGVNRKTFYYHFEDIYSLMRWTLEQEFINVIQKLDIITDYEQTIAFAIDYLEQNHHVILCIYDQFGRDTMRQILAKEFRPIISNLLLKLAQTENVSLEAGYYEFLTTTYTGIIADMIIEVLKEKPRIEKERLSSYLSRFFRESLIAVIQGVTRDGSN